MTSLPPLALLAGGTATRLGPLAASVPKALVPVAGAPFIHHQLRLLKRRGISRVILCTGHLGDSIETEIGNGERFGLSVAYSKDGPSLLGTGGAIRNALALLEDTFWILYGDSYLDIGFSPIAERFRSERKLGLMAVLKNNDRWDASNAAYADGLVTKYDKRRRSPGLDHVDFGLSLLRRSAFDDWRNTERFDLAELYTRLADRGQLLGYEVHQRFYEIGSPTGLEETRAYLEQKTKGENA